MAGSAAAKWRHFHLVATAGAPVDFFTCPELQVLGHANAHLAETLAVTGHGNRSIAESGIGLDESVFEFGRCDLLAFRELEIFAWNLHRGASLANGFEIS